MGCRFLILEGKPVDFLSMNCIKYCPYFLFKTKDISGKAWRLCASHKQWKVSEVAGLLSVSISLEGYTILADTDIIHIYVFREFIALFTCSVVYWIPVPTDC